LLEDVLQKFRARFGYPGELGGIVNRLFILRGHNRVNALLALGTLWLCFGTGATAQSTAVATNTSAPFSAQATHLLGLPNTNRNCNGTLSIQDSVLQFQRKGKPAVQVDITSVRQISLGDESKQVGGLPMKIGKAAAPYGGGRVVSLFAHKKYDTLTLEYADSTGGVHGAIFQLKKGQGELMRYELAARGVSSSSVEDQSTKQSSLEVTREHK
jgi:hypothetical protein